MEFNEFIELIEKHSPELFDENGDAYFGSKSALRDSNGIALVGLNPGGIGLPSIRKNLDLFLSDTSKELYTGFLDQCWHEPEYSNYKTCTLCDLSIKEHGYVRLGRHQKMIARIAEFCEFSLRESISINAIWIQTKDSSDLKAQLKKNNQSKVSEFFRNKFFPIFEELFFRCNIRFVICLGNGVSDSSFSLFKKALNVNNQDVINVSADYRDGRHFIAHVMGVKTLFFGIPHPSLHTLSDIGMEKLRSLKKDWVPKEVLINSLSENPHPQESKTDGLHLAENTDKSAIP